MKKQIFTAVLIACWSLVTLMPVRAEEPVTVESSAAETAVLDPANWSKVFAGKRYFDAIRPMLVRFPKIAEKTRTKLREGYRIEKAELVLNWTKQEGARPQRGRAGWGSEKAYKQNPGRWHAVVRPLLRRWSVEPAGPTADAYVDELAHWSRGVARAEGEDRAELTFGPTPLHGEQKTARLDVTPALKSDAWGKTRGERLRALGEKGFQVLKDELYDLKYGNQDGHWFSVYGWKPCTGYMRIWVEEPRLVLTLSKGAAPDWQLPDATDYARHVKELEKNPRGESHMAPPENWEKLAARFTEKPDDMPAWQWKRIEQLHRLGGWNLGGRLDAAPLLSLEKETYQNGLRNVLTAPPRYWYGHLTSSWALLPNAFEELLPDLVRDHLKLYWTAWLHPDTRWTESPRKRSYFRQYSWSLGTQNFNYNATAGCYLGGQVVDSDYVLRDARYGVEHLMLRGFGFYNGANQEVGDTYYQALSNAGAKMVADYAEDELGSLMARCTSDKLTEQLVSMYHPGLRRMTHPMGRGEMKYQCAYQDGPYFAVHTLSRSGALTDLKAGYEAKSYKKVTRYSVPVFGKEGPPGRMALLAPWAEQYWSNVVDGKKLPWEVVARDWTFYPDRGPSHWHVNYLGQNYSLASRTDGGVTPVTAQWRRQAQKVEHMQQLSTLQLSFGTNGRMYQAMNPYGVLQDKNRLMAIKALSPKNLMKAPPNPDYAGGWRTNEEGRGGSRYNAIHTTAAIIAFGDVSEREVWVDNRKIDKLSGDASPRKGHDYPWERHLRTTGENSVYVDEESVITIKDGVTYVALIPFAINPMECDREVEIAYEWPTLFVHSFLYRSEDPLDLNAWYGQEGEDRATSGFIVEMADESDYGSFEDFRTHMLQATVSDEWNAEAQTNHVEYETGDDTLAMGFYPWHQKSKNPDQLEHPSYRRVNGEDPYLAAGIIRESPWSILGRTGRLEKNGAVLESESGYRTYLLCEPKSGVASAYNPVPDPKFMRLVMPGGQAVAADGRLGLARITIDPHQSRVKVRYALKDAQKNRPDMASALVLSGFDEKPEVSLNGEPVEDLTTFTTEGAKAYGVPLVDEVQLTDLPTRVASAGELWKRIEQSDARRTYFRDWHVVGPFDSGSYAQENFQLKECGPEEGYNPDATYEGVRSGEKGMVPAQVRWKPALEEGENALSAKPLDLLKLFRPNEGVMAYATATIVSDRDRRVQVLGGSDERLGVWINGEKVLYNRGWRVCYRDQNRGFVDLKKGENDVLIKLSHGYESWRLYFRLADEHGMPIEDGVYYVGAHGKTPAGK